MFDLFIEGGVSEYIRSDNGTEFTAKEVKEWLSNVGVKTLYIEPGNPWKNAYNKLLMVSQLCQNIIFCNKVTFNENYFFCYFFNFNMYT